MQRRHAGAIVLAGGQGRRLTQKKGLLRIGGVPIVERVVQAARAAVGRVVVVGNASTPLAADVATVDDETPGAGPCHGLWVGLRTVHRPIAVVVAWDMPFVTADLLGYLVDVLDACQSAEAAVPRLGGRPQPLCAAYRQSCAQVLEHMQRGVNVAMRELLARLCVRWVDEVDLAAFGQPEKLLFNVNTPEDLALAEAWAAQDSASGSEGQQ